MDRSSLKLSALVMALTFLIALTVPAVAQEEGEPVPGSPFFFVITQKIDRTMMNEYAAAVIQVVAAHEKHEKGNEWAAFAPLTGGPDPELHYFLPMRSLGDIDGWVPNRQVILEALGEEAGGKVLQTFRECATSSSLILGYNSELSNPSPEQVQAPPAFVFFLHSTVEPAKAGEYSALIQKVKSAHQQYENGVHWIAYNNIIGGGEGAQFFIFAGMEKLGDLDDWPSTRQVLTNALGAEEAAAISKSLSQVAETHTVILALAPSFSHIGAPSSGDED